MVMTVHEEVIVYKVLRPDEWETLQRHGWSAGSPDDQRDGFIHLSTNEQIAGTLARHFSRPEDREVVILTMTICTQNITLKWEPSRDNELFPHLYSQMALDQVCRSHALSRAPDGHYVLPPELTA
jgi:uncharacterized protein (DUF952 family)